MELLRSLYRQFFLRLQKMYAERFDFAIDIGKPRYLIVKASPVSPATARRWSLDALIDSFLVVWLFIATGALIPLLVKGDAPHMTDDDRALLRIIYTLPPTVIAPLLILSRINAMILLLLRNPILLLTIFWVWLSVLWSLEPEITLRRGLGLTVFTLLACYLTLRHDFDWVLEKIAWICLFLLATSIFFVLFLPHLGIMPDGGSLRGVYTHKNGMGAFLVLAIAVLPPAIAAHLVNRKIGLIALFGAVLLLVPVNSATALVVGLVVLTAYAFLFGWRLSARIGVTVTLFGLSILSLLVLTVVANIDLIFAALGRDASLTGRTDLWRFIWSMIEQRPFFGYGYGAFWDFPTFVQYGLDAFGWGRPIPQAHNGYLELLLGLGVVGLALFSIFIGSLVARAMAAFGHKDSQVAVLALALIVGYLLHGMVESNLLAQSSIFWVLIVVCAANLTPNLAEIRQK